MKLAIFGILLINLLYIIVVQSFDLCPVSSDSNITAQSYYIYPLDLFYDVPGSVKTNVLSHIPSTSCHSYDGYGIIYNHTCPSMYFKDLCPIAVENVNKVTEVNHNSTITDYFCDLENVIHDTNETINIFIFGGSVTAGFLSQGCCSKPECNNMHLEPRMCTWSSYFSSWFKDYSKAKVRFHDFSKFGFSSLVTAQNLVSWLHRAGIKRLTKRDLLFFDHSRNDNGMVGSYKGVEKIFRILSILSNNTINAVTDQLTYPTVILLDTATTEKESKWIRTTHVAFYRDLSRHYRIPFWSVRDGIVEGYNMSNINATTTAHAKISPFYEFLTFNTKKRIDAHPAWYVNLYTADIIASTLLKEFQKCSKTSYSSNIGRFKHANNLKSIMPEPFYHLEDVRTCDPAVPPFLQMSYDTVHNNKPYIGKLYMPDNKWKVTTDIKGRGGFIYELPRNATCDNDNHARVVFALNLTADAVDKLKQPLQLQVQVMKSYANMGLVNVYYCGQKVGVIDALWDNYQTQRITVPDTYIIPDLRFNHTCTTLDPSGKVTVVLEHSMQNCAYNSTMLTTIEPQLRQLFKVMEVIVC